ncbi:hypothetical protein GCM10010960_00130 [Arenimonas maotaiensis]|uniref:DUF2721 domain-containing protein n=1 Tax=Arenimonas maotaiensis TaxID=1446479 RepID=A0A917CB63_9GAMM|nr:DUF2721 domain-containing protein [Arenimonas maotaiensis]GGF82041.1 hypothetical protein GCM10010960_00130 [Arenimonas maotaiensis]
MTPAIDSHYAVLTAMLAPALLMAATGSLLLSANNRLARVVDRLRILLTLWNAGERGHAALENQILRHRRRSNFLLRACLFLYCALGSFIGTSLALAVDALSGQRIPLLPTVMGLLGMAFLLGAAFYLGREVLAAVRSFEAEIRDEMA